MADQARVRKAAAKRAVAAKAPAKKAPARAVKKAQPRKAGAKKAPAKKVARKAAKKAVARVENPEAQAAIAEIENPPAGAELYEGGRKAHAELIKGKNWETVAMTTGFEHVSECMLAVRGYLTFVHTMTGDDERVIARRLELDRLDVIHDAWWDLATIGRDKDAAAVILKVSERRSKLLELENMSQRAGNSQTIIITAEAGGNGDDDMAGQLRMIALRGQQPQDVVDADVVED